MGKIGSRIMILSVSRRTDVPNYYSDWFLNRIKEGYLYVKNPMNIHQISKIDLSPNVVDCIVFWTKNPAPMIDKLNEMIPIFLKLSSKIGSEKVVWRYDPIIFTDKYTIGYHMDTFQKIASALNGYTDKVVISFFDIYIQKQRKICKKSMLQVWNILR